MNDEPNVPVEVYMRVKDLLKKDLLFLIIPLILAGIAYPFLPAQIPRQFHFNGEPTTYMAKEFLFLVALIPFVIYKLRQAKKN